MDSATTGARGNSELLDDFEDMYDYTILFNKSRDENAKEHEVSESRMSALKEIMEALTDPNISMMGVRGKEHNDMDYLLERVIRRARRDNLFGMIVMVSISKEPDLRRIQEDIAAELGLSFEGEGQEEKCAFCIFSNSNNKAVTENARQLSDRIRREPKILFILRDLQTRLDLAKLGIAYGVDQRGCKLILTSQGEEILSNQMNTQRTIKF